MISKTEHLRGRALEILTEWAERKVIAMGEIVPDVTLTTFHNRTLTVKQLVSGKPLLLTFMRASW